MNKAFGLLQTGTGFIYKTHCQTQYDYVLTARHIFSQEDDTEAYLEATKELIVFHNSKEYKINNVTTNVFVSTLCDIAIIRIPKLTDTNIVRVQVKELNHIKKDSYVETFSYPSFSPDTSLIRFKYRVQESGSFAIRMDEANMPDASQLHGISGSGVCDLEYPFLYGIVSMYSFANYRLADISLSQCYWSDLNQELKSRNWEQLDCGDSTTRRLTKNMRLVKDIEELCIRGTNLNMKRAIELLRYDIRDDWFFDPLRFKDKLNVDYVLDYFDSDKSRNEYTPSKYEIFYKPKEKPVLRKAMVGSFIDQLVYMALADKLSNLIYEKGMIHPCVYSAQINPIRPKNGLIVSGIEQWKKMNCLIDGWINEYSNKNFCFVKADLFNYYDSINKKKLISALYRICRNDDDEKTVDLLKLFLEKIDDKNVGAGLPQQCDPSAIFAAFYLSKVDEIMCSKAVRYCRFMDDIYFVAENKYHAKGLVRILETELRKLDLFINPQKVEFYHSQLDKHKLKKELHLFDHEIESIKVLSKSSVKSDRMNACHLIYQHLKDLRFDLKEAEKKHKYYLGILPYQNLKFKNAEEILPVLKDEVISLKDAPKLTDLLCRVIASFHDANVDISDIMNEIKKLILDENLYLSDWQLFNLWLLLGYTKHYDEELIRKAVNRTEENPENKRIVISAIMMYLVAVKENSKVIFTDFICHGNYQKRIKQIISRDTYPNSFENDIDKLDHTYLFKIAGKKLIYLRLPSKTSANGEETMDEFYSGK